MPDRPLKPIVAKLPKTKGTAKDITDKASAETLTSL